VAALANVLGGHLVVGVSTEMSAARCTGFHGIEKDVDARIAFEEQVRDRCRPTPVFNVRAIDVPTTAKVVVVVAVESSPVAHLGKGSPGLAPHESRDRAEPRRDPPRR
jgi:predicted HTH transcriptional regulator